jgi:putative transposase
MTTPDQTTQQNNEPADLTDEEWHRIAPLLPQSGAEGRPRTIDLRAVVNAIRYLKRTGCTWRGLPHRYPNHSSVRTYHDRWHRDGTWDRICVALGDAR